MKTQTLTIVMAALWTVASTVPLNAQSSAFTYQGRLNDSAGPVTGTFDFEFRLFDTFAGGVPIGSVVVQQDVTVAAGLFTVELDWGTSFDGADRFLDIAVRPGADTGPYAPLTPRQRLTPVPLALRALEAISIPAGSITSEQIADEAVTAGKLGAGSVGSSQIQDGAIVNADVSNSAAIADGKLATLATPGKVANSATTAASGNTANAIVARDASGGFSAGTIQGTFSGSGAALTSLNASQLSAGTVADARLSASVSLLGSSIESAEITDGTIVNADVAANAAIADTKLATISTSGKVANSATTAASGSTANAIVARDATGSFAAGTITASFVGSGAGLTALNASQLSAGTVPAGRLAGTYDQALTFSNPANGFTGNGGGLTGLNADQLASGTVPDARLASVVSRLGQSIESVEITDGTIQAVDVNAETFNTTFWRAGGNAGTTAGTHFLGTTDSQPLELKINSQRALRLEDNGDGSDGNAEPDGAPSLIGGASVNSVASGVVGAVIGGGGAGNFEGVSQPNLIASDYVTVGGGLGNRVGAASLAAVIAGGHLNDVGTNSAYAAISGGFDNNISTNSGYASIGGGIANDIGAGADYSVIGGGNDNGILATSPSSTIAGGYRNGIGVNSFYSAVGGGSDNIVGGGSIAVTISGGNANETGNNSGWSAIGGGYFNRTPVNAQFATIPGGTFNFATNYAFAAGRRARANHTGAFVWGDSTNADLVSTNADSVTLRAAGGYRLFTDSAGTAGVWLAPGDTAWAVISDRRLKKDFAPVDHAAVLEKLAGLPIRQWHYQWETSADTPHLGPMAQDFKASFYPGRDDTSITTLEFDGVALAAIQGLNQKVEARRQESEARDQRLEERLEQKEMEITELQRQNAELLRRLETIEARLR